MYALNECECLYDRASMVGNTSEWSSTTCDWNSLVSGVHRSASEQEQLREDLEWLYEPQSAYRVFIICLLIICGGELFQSPTTSMSDAATLQILGRNQLEKYGAQRAWGPVGWAAWYVYTARFDDGLILWDTPSVVSV